jgi:F420H(2)-dependent quinone reductase
VGYLDLADRNWPVLNRVFAAHSTIYRLTDGRIGQRIPGLPPFLLLDHVGARSGTKRTSPLIYFEDAENVVVVASKGGFPKNPAWFHNLKANPDTTVQIGREKRAVRARVAGQEERERLWPKAVDTYGDYATYQRRTERKIPLVVLEPR